MEALKIDINQIHEHWQQQGMDSALLKTGELARETVREVLPSENDSSDAQDILDTKTNRELLRRVIQEYQSNENQDNNLRHRMQIHVHSGKLQVAIVNYMTGETVEKIPSSKLLDWQMQLEERGLVVEAKA